MDVHAACDSSLHVNLLVGLLLALPSSNRKHCATRQASNMQLLFPAC
jgi:hypothetical protein